MIRSLPREIIVVAGLLVIVAVVFAFQGVPYSVRMLVEASCYALLALGLTIQWGYAGLFNVGILGFVAIGAFMTVFLSYPINPAFWNSDGAGMLGTVMVKLLVAVAVVTLVGQSHRVGVPRRARTISTIIVGAAAYLWISAALEPAARQIEADADFIGGFGLPALVGWLGGAIVAGLVAWGIGRITLGLRSDYLAIATIGIAEIIKAFLKNADWLTRGTLTVSPMPWPVPGPIDIGFTAARAAYLSLTAILIAIIYILLQRAYHAPWGRMMRAIRDNYDAAEAMGKDVDRRRLEIFILGSAIMGLGGAALITFAGVFDPAGFIPLNHTFLVWVMVILGGSGNNLGAILGAVFVYILWTMSEPLALWAFNLAAEFGASAFGWTPPDDLATRALQMRVFVIGLTISLVLRYAPQGILPEKLPKIRD